ncbi:hypothetical protein ACA910_003978 [Epithemia clementina (nom. ined.)]
MCRINTIYTTPHIRQSDSSCCCLKEKGTTNQEYLLQFTNVVEILDHCGARLDCDDGVIDKILANSAADPDNPTNAERTAAGVEARDWYLAFAFLAGADRTRYGRLLENLENDFLQGQDRYPKTVTAAYNLLVNWKQDPRNLIRMGGPVNDGVSFAVADTDDDVSTTTGTAHTTQSSGRGSASGQGGGRGGHGGHGGRGGRSNLSHVQCFWCKQYGHYASNCTADITAIQFSASQGEQPRNEEEETSQLTGSNSLVSGQLEDHNTAYSFLHGHIIPASRILLDNQSTVDIFSNPQLLRNIHSTDQSMKIHCNAGVAITNQQGILPGYANVWYHPQGIANILSLAQVKEKYKVTFDSSNGNEFHVFKPDGTIKHFVQAPSGLYYHDTSTGNTTLVNTVEQNKAKYTQADYACAVLARKIQQIIGRPSTAHFISIVKQRLLPNCPVTPDDIRAAEHIFGPDVGALKGKMVRQQPPAVQVDTQPIPLPILEGYRNVVLAGDVMYINRIQFLSQYPATSSLAQPK